MEYLAKKSFSFLQDCAFTSINNKSYTNKWNILQKSRFPFCKIVTDSNCAFVETAPEKGWVPFPDFDKQMT